MIPATVKHSNESIPVKIRATSFQFISKYMKRELNFYF